MSESIVALKLATEVDEAEGAANNAALAVGQVLKSAREELNLSIAAIAAEIRIRQQYLDSIEKGNLSDLPGQVYVVGFIKTYATFLKLDYEELLRQLNLEKEVFYNYSSFNYAIPATQQQYPSKKLVIVSLTLAVSLLSFIYYLSQQDGGDEVSFVGQHLVNTISVSKKGVDTLASDENYLTVTPSHEPITLEAEKNTSIVMANEPIDKNVYGVDVLKPAEQLQPTAPVQAINANQIQIIAIQDAWVQVLDQSGKTIYVRLMHAGDSYTLPSGQLGCTLNTGNAGGVKIRFGDQESSVLGATGKIIRGMALTNESMASILTAKQ